MIAIRLACRAFYDYRLDDDLDAVPLSEDELVAKCDVKAVEWRGDCYNQDVPESFVSSVGGCADLGGYLSVAFGDRTAEWGGRAFPVGNGDVWTILPESD